MDLAAIMNKIEELSQKVTSLEKVYKDHTNSSVFVKMDVKDLHLNTLNLDELAFHLDKLDIKELSGMLNLGNTFSPTIQPKQPSKQKPTSRTPPTHEEDIVVKVNGKAVPYTIF